MDAAAGGVGCGAASLLFRNQDTDFPEWKGRDLRSVLPEVRLIPIAAEGATSAAVRYAQIPKLREMEIAPSLVTVTMGEYDLWQCFGNEDAVREAHRALWNHAHAVLGRLRESMLPDAPLVVSTLSDSGDGQEASAWPERFNETLRAVAGEHGALVADIRGYLPSNPGGASAIRAAWWETLQAVGFIKEGV